MKGLEKNENYTNQTFEDIKHTDENEIEFWYARELMPVLQYAKWENFKKVIEKAIVACENSEISAKDCFLDIRKPIISGKGKEEFIEDYKLTRYACYLIAQNGDTRKKVIALAQTYFAIQTRKQEISEKEYSSLTEENKRGMIKFFNILDNLYAPSLFAREKLQSNFSVKCIYIIGSS